MLLGEAKRKAPAQAELRPTCAGASCVNREVILTHTNDFLNTDNFLQMSLPRKSILVTGADGFIGSRLVSALRALGYVVLSHSRRQGDIKDCHLSFEGVGHVFHLAARTFVPDSWAAPLSFYEANLLGTVNVLEFCRAQAASVTLMSSYVYGPPARLPISEDDPLRAFNPYSHTKILAEQTGLYYQRQFGVPVTIVRPFNIYGPRQDRRFLIPS